MNKILLGLLGLVLTVNAMEVYATFNVVAQKDAKLAFNTGGITSKVNVDIASEVKKDAVLASLKNDDMRASLERAKTALKFAKKDYERQLKIKNLIDARMFDQYAYKYENAKNELAYAQANYDKTFLRAPFDGIIYAKDIEVGDTVSGMMLKTVFKIQSKSERKLILEFDQKYHNIVNVGNNFKYKIDGDTKTYIGEISKIYPNANNSNRKMKAEVEVKSFIPGLFGSGYITAIEK